MRSFALPLAFLLSTIATQAAPPNHATIGWPDTDGDVLLGELGCVACHDAGPNHFLHRQAPRLGDIGKRIDPIYLRRLLNDPKVKPGTIMPDLLHGMDADQKEKVIDALVHFLVSRGGPMKRPDIKLEPQDISKGKVLYHKVGCVACHEPFETPAFVLPKGGDEPDASDRQIPSLKNPSISLGGLHAKTTPHNLAAFLANPAATRPSGRMPSFQLQGEEAWQIAAYLIHRSSIKNSIPVPPIEFKIDSAKAAVGKKLFALIGCASCHDTSISKEPEELNLIALKAMATGFDDKENRSPAGESPRHAIDGTTTSKYLNFGRENSGLLIKFPGAAVTVGGLAVTSANDQPGRDPAAFRLEGSNDGTHFKPIHTQEIPVFKDRHTEQKFWFENGEAWSMYRFTVTKIRDPNGANCTQFAELRLFEVTPPAPGIVSTLKAPALVTLKPNNGCLSNKPGAGQPRYALDEDQRGRLRRTLSELKIARRAPTPEILIHRNMSAMNCYACHDRGGKGGPEPGRAKYFTTESPVDLGEEGRLPPSLDLAGAKLNPNGFAEVLLGRNRLRPHMSTRMPVFGKNNTEHLSTLFAGADVNRIAARETLEPDKKLVRAGRELVGNKGFGCVNCHGWGGQKSLGIPGADLSLVASRLNPGWFHQWLSNPNALREGTRMPSFWPKGKSPIANLLGGDAEKQKDAIWAYLSTGTRGGAPRGIKVESTGNLLEPSEGPMVFRTFLDGVSAHAILVGFPEQAHVAFDANRVRSVVAWSGDFIGTKAAWDGRAGQYAKIPGETVLTFPDGPPFARLKSESEPWPEDVPKAKMGSTRTPPGWKYRGYRFDEDRVPIFMYRVGDVNVEETFSSGFRSHANLLTRRLTFTAKTDVPDLVFRIAVGKTISKTDDAYVVDAETKYRFKYDPQIRPGETNSELLWPVKFKRSSGSVWNAEQEVEIEW